MLLLLLVLGNNCCMQHKIVHRKIPQKCLCTTRENSSQNSAETLSVKHLKLDHILYVDITEVVNLDVVNVLKLFLFAWEMKKTSTVYKVEDQYTTILS